MATNVLSIGPTNSRRGSAARVGRVSASTSRTRALSVDGSYALGTELYGVMDLNLDQTPDFALSSEGGRPVYVPASSIVPYSGATTLAASRLHPEFGYVFDVDKGTLKPDSMAGAYACGVNIAKPIVSVEARGSEPSAFGPLDVLKVMEMARKAMAKRVSLGVEQLKESP